MILDRGKR